VNKHDGRFVDSDVNSSDSESVESDSSDEQPVAVQKNVSKPSAKSNVDLLLELDDCEFLKFVDCVFSYVACLVGKRYIYGRGAHNWHIMM